MAVEINVSEAGGIEYFPPYILPLKFPQLEESKCSQACVPGKETSLYLESTQCFCPHNFLSWSHAVERKCFPSTCSAEHGELISRRLQLSNVELDRGLISLFICFLQQLPWTEAHSVKLIFTSFLSSLSGKVVASGSGRPVSNPPELLQSQIVGTHQMRVGWPKAGVAEVAAYIFFLVILRNFSSKANCLKSVLKQSGKSRQTPTWLHITKTPAKGEDPNETARCQGGEQPRPQYSQGKCQSTEALTWESSVQTPRELLLSAASHPILQRYDPPTHVDIVLQKACVFLLCW